MRDLWHSMHHFWTATNVPFRVKTIARQSKVQSADSSEIEGVDQDYLALDRQIMNHGRVVLGKQSSHEVTTEGGTQRRYLPQNKT